jgi:hypothetical protein
MGGALTGEGLVELRVRVADDDAVILRSILEAYEGLASYWADGSGVYVLIAPEGRGGELAGLLADLQREGLALTRLDSAVF